MKLFWTIITIFSLTAGVMVWAQTRVAEADVSFMTGAGAEYQSKAPADPLIARTPEEPRFMGVTSDPAREVIEAPTPDDDEREQLAQQLVNDLLDEPRSPLDPDAAGMHAGHQEEVERAENPWMAAQAPAGEQGRIEHSIEAQPDGSKLVDGLFTLRGNGTASSPYEITWDYLMSAAESYQPRLGMDEMPERIKMLDGQHVKIAGFLMFPMATFEAKEALVMLNMWDGCCIGTMPSPYDAVEVQFTQGVPSSVRQFASYGSVEGKLVVDPYLISDWLIGLYVLEDATLNVGM